MASTSSLALSQAFLTRAISNNGFDKCVSMLAFSGLKSISSRTISSRRYNTSTSSHSLRPLVRAAAIETIDTTSDSSLVDKSVNTIRFLAIDAVEKAKSGNPGLPMGCAPYDDVMRYNPKNTYWFNRDRFVLYAGHGSMLHYALLHLAGYDSVREEDLKSFRQWGSPLGQGSANAVGLALAEKHLAARFNKPDNEIVDHYTVLPSDVSARVSIEAGSAFGWGKIVGGKRKSIGIDSFGSSAPAGKLYKEFGITIEAMVEAAKSVI